MAIGAVGAVDVKGNVTGWTIYRLHQRKKIGLRPLIELRGDFHPELPTRTASL